MFNVFYNGQSIYANDDPELVLLNTSLTIEIGAAGEFRFSMAPNHLFYNSITSMQGTIEVQENMSTIWYGRPREVSIDINGLKTYYCEGALAYLNDTVQESGEWEDLTTLEYLQKIITRHNSLASSDRTFGIGQVTVNYRSHQYREFNYENTLEAIKQFVIGTDGGYLQAQRYNGMNVLDWREEFPDSCNQPVKFGMNMVDITWGENHDDLCTGVIVIGGVPPKEEEEEDTEEDTSENTEGESDEDEEEEEEEEPVVVGPIWAGAASHYGRIVKKLEYPDVYEEEYLTLLGEKYLAEMSTNTITIECNAVDLHPINPEYQNFYVGHKVRCISDPLGINQVLTLMKMKIKIETGEKIITLGNDRKRALTDFIKEEDDKDKEDKELKKKVKKNTKKIKKNIDDIDKNKGDIQTLKDRLDNLDPQVGGWIHKINGVTSATGTINFITVD